MAVCNAGTGEVNFWHFPLLGKQKKLANVSLKIRKFGHDARKYRLVNTVTASFDTIMGQLSEMSQRKKSSYAVPQELELELIDMH